MASAPRPRFGAIPYRRREDGGWELLLVRTGKGRWTFPKGKAEVGEDGRTAAVRECFEECGATGTLEAAGCRYVGDGGIEVEVFLLAVDRQVDGPEHRRRRPRWFALDAAEAALAEGRPPATAREFARAVAWARRQLG